MQIHVTSGSKKHCSHHVTFVYRNNGNVLSRPSQFSSQICFLTFDCLADMLWCQQPCPNHTQTPPIPYTIAFFKVPVLLLEGLLYSNFTAGVSCTQTTPIGSNKGEKDLVSFYIWLTSMCFKYWNSFLGRMYDSSPNLMRKLLLSRSTTTA